jgi:EpsD family peptidyl-prolyl cis-trans isomerase
MIKRLCAVLCLGALIAFGVRAQGTEVNPNQSAVTVNGEAIAWSDVLAATQGRDQPGLLLRALDALLTERLLLQAALRNGLDQRSAGLEAKQRAKESVLAQAWLSKNMQPIAPPSEDDVSAFIKNNPKHFAQRKTYQFSRMIIPLGSGWTKDRLEAGFKTVRDMPEFRDWLRRAGLGQNIETLFWGSEQITPAQLVLLENMADSEMRLWFSPDRAVAVALTRHAAFDDPIDAQKARAAVARGLFLDARDAQLRQKGIDPNNVADIAKRAIAQGLQEDPAVVRAIEAAQRRALGNAHLEQVLANVERPGLARVNQILQGRPDFFADRRVFRYVEMLTNQPISQAGPELSKMAERNVRTERWFGFLEEREWLGAGLIHWRGPEEIAPKVLEQLKLMANGQSVVMPGEPDQPAVVIQRLGSYAAPLETEEARRRVSQSLFDQDRAEAARAELAKLRAQATLVYSPAVESLRVEGAKLAAQRPSYSAEQQKVFGFLAGQSVLMLLWAVAIYWLVKRSVKAAGFVVPELDRGVSVRRSRSGPLARFLRDLSVNTNFLIFMAVVFAGIALFGFAATVIPARGILPTPRLVIGVAVGVAFGLALVLLLWRLLRPIVKGKRLARWAPVGVCFAAQAGLLAATRLT